MSYNPKHDCMIGGLLVPTDGPLGQTIQVYPRLLSDDIAMRLFADMTLYNRKIDGGATAETLAASAYALADVLLAERASRMAAAKLSSGNGGKA
jgi:hypothetical protein